jgi:ABC-type antimicrobial peptide transport system permease subunit
VLEILIAAGIVLVLLALAFVSTLAPMLGLIVAGAGLVLVGTVIGIPGGIVYHLVLARTLAARAALPKRWWLWPTTLHAQLLAQERRTVMPWFYAGAIGFTLIVVGAIAVAAGALLAARELGP